MKTILILFFTFLSTFSFSQTREELLEQFMKERRQMMEQMIQIFQDDFNNDDFFRFA